MKAARTGKWADPAFLRRYWRDYQRKRRMRNVRAGRCYCGNERDGDRTHCRRCLDYAAKSKDKLRNNFGFCLDCLSMGKHRDGCLQKRLPVDR